MSQEMIDQITSAVIAAQEAQRAKRRAARAKRQEEDAAAGSTRKSFSLHLALTKEDYDLIRAYVEKYGDGRSINVVCTKFIKEGIARATAAESEGGNE